MTITANKSTAKPLHVAISKNQSDWLRIDAATPDMAEWVKDHLPGFISCTMKKQWISEIDSSKAPVEFGATISPVFDIVEVRDWFNENYPKK